MACSWRSTPSHSIYTNLNGNSNSTDCETKVIDPLLYRFLSSLNAKRVASPRGYQIYTLQPGAYTETLESLRESDTEVWGYVLGKLRHDLINDKCLVLKMLGTIHELAAEAIGDLIKSQLATIVETTSNEGTQQLIGEIRAGCSRQVQLNGPKTFRQPDKQFLVKGSYYPGIVIEFACSESFKELRQKAYDFIVRSGGRVQLVIGLEAGSKKLFKISAWRPEFYRSENGDAMRMKAITDRDIIRYSDGTLKSGCFRFHLQDFGRDLAVHYPDAHLTTEIALDYDVLAGYIIDAEQCDVLSPPGPDIILRVQAELLLAPR
ncbi:hypothetical protein GJ744_005818 [Endocarpon pusillum]|uniref:Uncharacterized protein n=1 Tax=Endocarpon pusillum TaxID=364733 RepID=A0A8H7DYJ4_9EURO|nr:hypothetical protein GJ744_005818 [Endocarpon pusillum]